MKDKILLVDDEKDIVEFLGYNLIQEGFDVIQAYNGKEALVMMEQNPDLVILDVLMPQMDGYKVCKQLRENPRYKEIPVIFLTAKGGENEEIRGLNLGADDFIQKPISPKKLIARVKSNLRRYESKRKQVRNDIISIGPLTINREKYTVTLEGENLVLPKKEFEILAYLADNPGKVFSRENILNDIWGDNIYVVERTIDVHVRKIREKFGDHSELIETIKGVGYRFKNF